MNHDHSYRRTLCNSQGNAVGLWKDLQEISLTKKKKRKMQNIVYNMIPSVYF